MQGELDRFQLKLARIRKVVAPFVRDAVVQYYAQTSQIEPVILDYDSFDWSRIGFRPDHPGAQLFEKMNTWSCERGRGRFLIQPRGLDTNPSDTAKALRGNSLFTDFVEHPAELHHLLEIATQCSIDSIEHQRQVIGGSTSGGYGTTWHGGYWTPDNVIGHLGDNVSDLVSGRMFEQFLLPYLQKFTSHFGGCIFARDITSKQVWRYLRMLGNILAFKPRNMGNTCVIAEDIYKIVDHTEGLPLFLQVFSFEEFEGFRRVVAETGVSAFFVFQCPTREEGERALDMVRGME